MRGRCWGEARGVEMKVLRAWRKVLRERRVLPRALFPHFPPRAEGAKAAAAPLPGPGTVVLVPAEGSPEHSGPGSCRLGALRSGSQPGSAAQRRPLCPQRTPGTAARRTGKFRDAFV